MSDPILYLSISAYARRYGVDRHTVYKWLELGVLEHYRVLKLIRIKDAPPAPQSGVTLGPMASTGTAPLA